MAFYRLRSPTLLPGMRYGYDLLQQDELIVSSEKSSQVVLPVVLVHAHPRPGSRCQDLHLIHEAE